MVQWRSIQDNPTWPWIKPMRISLIHTPSPDDNNVDKEGGLVGAVINDSQSEEGTTINT